MNGAIQNDIESIVKAIASNTEIETVLEWLNFAEADFDSAVILNDAHRKHNEIICYLCQQAVD